MAKKYVNGIQMDTTAEDDAQIQADRTAWENGRLDRSLDELRMKRNGLLRMSDWTQFNDSPLDVSKKNEWKTYRQELRDLPIGLDTVDKVVNKIFPTKPS
tara:strand:- start:54 stop:353 length:300 start_codon:yes stop_codon:yes gene_type:complete